MGFQLKNPHGTYDKCGVESVGVKAASHSSVWLTSSITHGRVEEVAQGKAQ